MNFNEKLLKIEIYLLQKQYITRNNEVILPREAISVYESDESLGKVTLISREGRFVLDINDLFDAVKVMKCLDDLSFGISNPNFPEYFWRYAPKPLDSDFVLTEY
jgi:hypothetical protein